jgi:AIPR protein
MTSTDTLTSSDTLVQIPVHQDQIRVLVDPVEPKSKSRAIACVAVQDLYSSGIGDWLEANVRFQKMNSSIAKDILKTLDERPENMHPLNRGLTVLANGFRYDSQVRAMMIQFRDPKRHGIIDGGHTFKAVELIVKERMDAGLEPPKAFVNVEVLAGYDDIASDIISARNSVCAVRSSAIYALDGVFDDLRQYLAKARMEELVAFKQNEDKPISVEEVIAVLHLFHPAFADGNNHPTKSYSSRATCVETYAEEWTLVKDAKDSSRWKQGFGKIVHLTPEFLRLTEEIESEVDTTYRAGGGIKGLVNDQAENTKEGKDAS